MTDQVTTKPAEVEADDREKKDFPYTSIFGTNGLLSELQPVEAQDQRQQALAVISEDFKPEPKKNEEGIMKEAEMPINNDDDLPGQMRDLLPPNEAVVGIDLILEKVFSSLSPRQLLKCRLVSHRWRTFAQVPLQKLLHFKFINQILIPPIKLKSKSKGKAKAKAISETASGTLDSPKTSSKTLTDFNKFLELSLNNCGSLSFPFIFPGSKFFFRDTLLSDAQLQKFLVLHGQCVDELTLIFYPPADFYTRPEWSTSSKYPHPLENELMMQVKTLLLEQAQNLSVLKLGHYSDVDWRYHSANCSIEDLQNLPLDSNVVGNYHLKSLHVLGILSAKVFQVICALCPSLGEISFDGNNFDRVLSPVNRIHCLKTLFFNLRSADYGDLATYEDLASAIDLGKENLQLRTLGVHIHDALRTYDFAGDPEVEKRVVNVLNKILESSCNSLRKIKWDGVTFLKGVKWPLVLPNVTQLELLNPINPNSRGYRTVFPNRYGSLQEMLQQGSGHFKEMFPKLRHLKFVNLKNDGGRDCLSIVDFLAWLNIFVPSTGIQSVLIEGFVVNCNGVKSVSGSSKLQSEYLSVLFPGAQIRLRSVRTKRRNYF